MIIYTAINIFSFWIFTTLSQGSKHRNSLLNNHSLIMFDNLTTLYKMSQIILTGTWCRSINCKEKSKFGRQIIFTSWWQLVSQFLNGTRLHTRCINSIHSVTHVTLGKTLQIFSRHERKHYSEHLSESCIIVYTGAKNSISLRNFPIALRIEKVNLHNPYGSREN